MNIIYSNNTKFKKLWGYLLVNDIYQYPLYSSLEISYQKLYLPKYDFSDLSFLIEENNSPILGMIISKHKNSDGIYEFSGFGRPVYYIENNQVSKRILKGAQKKVKKILENYFEESNSFKFIFQDFLYSNRLSFLSDLLILKKATVFPVFSQIIYLKQNESELHEGLRKSYRSLVNWGSNNLKINIIDSEIIKENHIESFRMLHKQVAGRETRNRDSWLKQLEMVNQDQAFLVFGYLNNNLATAAFFSYSKKLCYYAVSASIRKLFEKPLSHSILYSAIRHAKELGCEYFETGEILFPNYGKKLPSSKELGISTFKRGFGGNTYLRLNIELNKKVE